jgi:acyl-CoA dehydrogenase
MEDLKTGRPVAAKQPDSLQHRAERAAAVALKYADSVDREARFPHEAMAALRAENLLGVLVPSRLGGEGSTVSDVAQVCYTLGRACASTAMIYAMHQTKVACITNHGLGSAWHESLLRRLVKEQLLFASSTTEGKAGGNVRSSASPIVQEGATISLVRDASVISYGAQADGVVTTARRDEKAEPTDQVLAVFLKEDYELETTVGWDTLGMRGTCSSGFNLKAKGIPGQVLPVPYDRIHAQTMTPVAHVLWSSVWAGIAAASVAKAEMFVRRALRGSGGQLPPGAAHLNKAKSSLRLLRNLISTSLDLFERSRSEERYAASLDYQVTLTLTKVEASELAVDTVLSCYRTCGLAGYRNDGDVSISRHLRDVLSSPIMINNERIVANMSNALLMSGVPATLAG